MDEEIEPNLLLEPHNAFDLFLDELVVLSLGDLTLAKLSTGLTNFLSLLCLPVRHRPRGCSRRTYRERSNGGGRELGQVEMLRLDVLANSERTLTVKLIGGDGSDALAYGIV